MTKPTPTPRDKTAAAARRRLWFLRKFPLCAHCIREGKAVAATELDHIKALHQGGDNSIENSQGLCHTHHAIKSAAERGFQPKPVIALDGWPIER